MRPRMGEHAHRSNGNGKPQESFMYKEILVPVDGSVASGKGLSEALALAVHCKSHLTLLHIVDEYVMDLSWGAGIQAAHLIDSMRSQGQGLLDTALKIAKERGLEASSMLVEASDGRIANHVIDKAVQIQADLIVMGTHGRRGVKRLT